MKYGTLLLFVQSLINLYFIIIDFNNYLIIINIYLYPDLNKIKYKTETKTCKNKLEVKVIYITSPFFNSELIQYTKFITHLFMSMCSNSWQ